MHSAICDDPDPIIFECFGPDYESGEGEHCQQE
jgi:hypothetical protein